MKYIFISLILSLGSLPAFCQENGEIQQFKNEIERLAPGESESVPVESTATKARTSRVYFFDGFVVHIPFTKLNTKVDDLGKQLQQSFPNVLFSFQHNMTWDQVCEELKNLKEDEKPEHLILIGHSYGASGAMSVAHCINPMPVDLVITLDGHTWPGRKPTDLVPENVAINYNYFETLDIFINPIPYPHTLQGIERNHREDDSVRGITNQKINLKLFKDVTVLAIEPHYEVVYKVFKAGMINQLVEMSLKNELVSGLLINQ